MKDAIERFLLAKRSENASPCTIRAYRADLEDLSKFIGIQQGPELLSREIVRGFLAMLHKRGAIKTTASRKLSAIKSFVRWLASEEIIGDDAFQKLITIKRPKLPDTLPDVPSKEEMAALLDGGDFPTAFPARDKLLCELMYGAGLRVSEAAHITLDDLRPEQSVILIHGKGGPYGKSARPRLVPLNPHSQKALDASRGAAEDNGKSQAGNAVPFLRAAKQRGWVGHFGAERLPNAAAHDEGARTPTDAPASFTPCLRDSHARQRLSPGCHRPDPGTRQPGRNGTLCVGFNTSDDGHL